MQTITTKYLIPISKQFIRSFASASAQAVPKSKVTETYSITAQGTHPGGVTWKSGKTGKEHHTEHELESLLGALAGCQSSTASYYAKEAGIDYKNLYFSLEGDYDFNTHLKNSDAPNRFKKVRVNVEVETDGSDKQIAELRKLVEAHCPIDHMLKKSGVDFDVNWKKK